MKRLWARMILAIALLLATNGGPAQRKALAAPDVTGAVIHFVCCAYTPSEVVIQPGQAVEWDGDFSFHPLVSDDGLWITQTVRTQFVYTFTMTGTFGFHCAIHGPFGMTGQVVVQEFLKVYLPLVLKA